MPVKEITKEIVILLGAAILCAFAVNVVSPKGIALFGQWDTSKGVISARNKNDAVEDHLEIKDTRSAKRIFDTADTVFVDARSAEDYKDGHIKGAISLPAYEFDSLIDRFYNDFPVSVSIVTYCSGRECDDSHELAQLLIGEGYTKVNVFIDGYPAWKEEGYPVE